MVGYSLRLELVTTISGLLLAGLGSAGRGDLLLVVVAVLVAISAVRVLREVRRWEDPVVRARVVAA